MSREALALALLLLLAQFPALRAASDLAVENVFVYSVAGEYVGKYRVEMSGAYKALLAGNYSDYRRGYVEIEYVYGFALSIFMSEGAYAYAYSYYLKDYSVNYWNVPLRAVAAMSRELNRILNRTIISYSTAVDLPLIVNVSIANGSVSLVGLGSKRPIGGISLFDDVVCFEYSAYREELSSGRSYRLIYKVVYDAISYTPLYLYLRSQAVDSFNETNYVSYFVEVNQRGIGRGLSRLSSSRTIRFSFESGGSGSVGLVTYGRSGGIAASLRDGILVVSVNGCCPYRLIVTIDEASALNSSSAELEVVNLRGRTVYVSPILTSNNNYSFSFSHRIASLDDPSESAVSAGEVTVQEREHASISAAAFVAIINALAIYLLYKLQRAFAEAIRSALSD